MAVQMAFSQNSPSRHLPSSACWFDHQQVTHSHQRISHSVNRPWICNHQNCIQGWLSIFQLCDLSQETGVLTFLRCEFTSLAIQCYFEGAIKIMQNILISKLFK